MQQVRVLHLDDNLLFLDKLKSALEAPPSGLLVTSTADEASFLCELPLSDYRIVIVDIHLGKGTKRSGLDLIPKVFETRPDAMVLICSHDSQRSAIQQALQLGAYDFVTKAASETELALRVNQTFMHFCRRNSGVVPDGVSFVGKAMAAIAAAVPDLVASAVTTIHVHGPSGSGKEVVADLFAKHTAERLPFVRVS